MNHCETADCPNEAVALVQFPWAEPVLACSQHLASAKQLMTNLGREAELGVRTLPQSAEPEPVVIETTAVPVPLGVALEREREERVRGTSPNELQVEQVRLERVRAQQALVQSVDALLDRLVDAATVFGAQLVTKLREGLEPPVPEAAPEPEPEPEPLPDLEPAAETPRNP